MSEEQNPQEGKSIRVSKEQKKTFVGDLFFSPGERRLRAGWRLLIQFGLLAVFVLGVQFIVRYFLYPKYSSLSNYNYFISQLTILLGITGSVFVSRVVIDNRSFQSLGLYLDAVAGRDFGMGMAISFLMIGFTFLLQWAIGWVRFQNFIWSLDFRRTFVLFWLIFLGIFLLNAWQEELLFRGYWFTNLKEGLNTYWAIGLSAVAYAVLHLFNPNYSPRSLIFIAFMGVFLGYALVNTNQLWLPMGLHFGWKFFQGNFFGFRVGGLGAPGLIIHQVEGPSLWTGGQIGPEAGLVILPAILLGSFFVWMYTSFEV